MSVERTSTDRLKGRHRPAKVRPISTDQAAVCLTAYAEVRAEIKCLTRFF